MPKNGGPLQRRLQPPPQKKSSPYSAIVSKLDPLSRPCATVLALRTIAISPYLGACQEFPPAPRTSNPRPREAKADSGAPAPIARERLPLACVILLARPLLREGVQPPKIDDAATSPQPACERSRTNTTSGGIVRD